MADQKLSQLTNLGAPPAATDELYLLDGGATDKALQAQYLMDYISTGARWQSFQLDIKNDAGTLVHSNKNDLGTSIDDKFNNMVGTSQVTTPTGTDASTAFASGLKISSAGTHQIILDSINAQTAASMYFCATIATNQVNTTVFVRPTIESVDVNGTTLARITLSVTDITGTAFALNTTNIPSGKALLINCAGYVL